MRPTIPFKPRNLGTPLRAPRNRLDLQLALLWESLLGIRPIGVDDRFFDLGGNTLLAERLIAEVGNRTGRNLSLPGFLEEPTVEHLADMIRRTNWSPCWTSRVSIQEGGSQPPLFFVHAPRGYVFLYYHVARHLGSDQPVYGLQAVGVDRKRAPHFRFEQMAAHYIQEMRSLQPRGPYFLSGFCLGGVLAFEMARQLHAQGCRVGLLALIDTYPPIPPALAKSTRSSKRQSTTKTKARLHLNRFLQRAPKDRFAYAFRRLRNVGLVAKIHLWNRIYSYYVRRGRPLPRVFHDVYMINVQALFAYKPRVYPGKVTLLTTQAAIDEMAIGPEKAWEEFAGDGLEPYTLNCDHENLMTDPNARQVAAILQRCLYRAMPAEGRRESNKAP